MKKLLSLVLALFVLASSFCLTAFAATGAEPISVYITIADKGTLAVSVEKIAVTDRDTNGSVTIDEALYAAHEKYYTGGAAAGYASETTLWGLSITKLWGDESGSFVYYLNNAQVATDLTAPLAENDYICAYVIKDSVGWSDAYTYFDKKTAEAKIGEEVTLNLSVSSFDASWNEVFLPLVDATITVNGEATEYKTDSEGKVTIKFDKGGKYTVSAIVADTTVIVPPVCVVTVPEDISDKDEIKDNETQTETKDEGKKETKPEQKTEASPKTGDNAGIYIAFVLVTLIAVATALKKNTFYEK